MDLMKEIPHFIVFVLAVIIIRVITSTIILIAIVVIVTIVIIIIDHFIPKMAAINKFIAINNPIDFIPNDYMELEPVFKLIHHNFVNLIAVIKVQYLT